MRASLRVRARPICLEVVQNPISASPRTQAPRGFRQVLEEAYPPTVAVTASSPTARKPRPAGLSSFSEPSRSVPRCLGTAPPKRVWSGLKVQSGSKFSRRHAARPRPRPGIPRRRHPVAPGRPDRHPHSRHRAQRGAARGPGRGRARIGQAVLWHRFLVTGDEITDELIEHVVDDILVPYVAPA